MSASFFGIRRTSPDARDLVRMDRAILYLRNRATNLISNLESRTTKSIGDSSYAVASFLNEVSQICNMGGERELSRAIHRTLGSYTSRTPNNEMLARVREAFRLLEQYNPAADSSNVQELQERIESLEELLANQPDSESHEGKVPDTSEESSVFVIMPFHADFSDVWSGAIKSAIEAEKLKPIRVDMINRSSNITEDIIESISKCHIAIVDVTNNNPNVMFELGYALAKLKPCIIISQSADYLPFDIRNIRTIVYKNTWSGVEELRLKIQSFLRERHKGRQIGQKAHANGPKAKAVD